MFGFLMGLVLGAIGGAAYGSRYFRDTDMQTQFNDTQDRLTNLMTEVRAVLDETRGELRQAWERTRESAVEKAERIQTAVTPAMGEGGGAGASGATAGGAGASGGAGGSGGGAGTSGGGSNGGTSGGGRSGGSGGASKTSGGASAAA